MTNFQEMGLSPILTQALDKLGFVQPTLIQAKTIPLALQNKDILGSAQTGTGKTLAFSLPLVNQLLSNPTGMGLILTPTRELAQQVFTTVNQLLPKSLSMRTALLIGGEPYNKQLAQLRSNVRIIIGTPGRTIDHLERRSFKPDAINFLVLDETDRMFDMGFSIQLEQIVSQLPTQRQTLMFSATFPPTIEKLATKYMQTPERVFVNEFDSMAIVAQNLTQEILEIKEEDKYLELLTQLNSRDGSVLIFVKTKDNAERLSIRLNKEDYNTCAIHGNLRQNKREQVMRAFRQGRHQVMVATDIAARGLDVPHVMHVVNYDIPHAPEDYVHRVGRTARAGAKGFAISFVSSQDRKRWHAIQALLNPNQDRPEQDRSRKRNSRSANSSSRSRSQGTGSTRGSKENSFQKSVKFSKHAETAEFPRSSRSQEGRFQKSANFSKRVESSEFPRSRSQRIDSPRSLQESRFRKNVNSSKHAENPEFSRSRSQGTGLQESRFQKSGKFSKHTSAPAFANIGFNKNKFGGKKRYQ